MSVLIRGRKMPKSCSRCFCMALCRLWKNIMHPEFNRHRNCPLAPVPPHGRLIDAAALWVEINKICDRRDAGIITDLTCLQQILSTLRHAPAVIQAEEAELTGTDMGGGIRMDEAGNVIDWGIVGPPGEVGRTEAEG